MELETKRLILRGWQEHDAASLYKYAQNPNIGPIAGWPVHTSIEHSRDIIKKVISVDETYAVVLKQTGEAIGCIGLMMSKSEINTAEMSEGKAEIGYWIGEPFWGQGLIPEAVRELLRHAFEDLGLTAVWCGYYDGNEKSKRVQEKCGFVYHHTEYNKPVPLMNDFRTSHYAKLLSKDWKNTDTKIFQTRQDHELPLCIEDWGWKYHHLGIPTDKVKPNERYLPHLKFYVSGFNESPFGIEWMRFDDDCPMSDIIKSVPHIAFEVEDIDKEFAGHNFEILSEPGIPSDGVRAAMILHHGAPIELIEFAKNKKQGIEKPNT